MTAAALTPTPTNSASREVELLDLIAAARRLFMRRDRPGRPLDGDGFDAWEDDVEQWVKNAAPGSLDRVGRFRAPELVENARKAALAYHASRREAATAKAA